MFCDEKVSVLPDFIANCGMARVFAYLHNANAVINDKLIFEDTAKTIHDALNDVYKLNTSRTKIAATAFEIALKKLL